MPPTIFKNEPLTDFSKPKNRKGMERALAAVKAGLGKTYPLVIGKQEFFTEETFPSINPSRPEEQVGVFSKAEP